MDDRAYKYRLRIQAGLMTLLIRVGSTDEAVRFVHRLDQGRAGADLAIETWDRDTSSWIVSDRLLVAAAGGNTSDTRLGGGGSPARVFWLVAAMLVGLAGGAAGTHFSSQVAPGAGEVRKTMVSAVLPPVTPISSAVHPPLAMSAAPVVSVPAAAVVPEDSAKAPGQLSGTTVPPGARDTVWQPGEADFRKMAEKVGVTSDDHHGMFGPWSVPGGMAVAFWGQCGGSACGSKEWFFVLYRPDGEATVSRGVLANDGEVPRLDGGSVLLKGLSERGKEALWTFRDGVLDQSSKPIPVAALSREHCGHYYNLVERECAAADNCDSYLDSMSMFAMREVDNIGKSWPGRRRVFDRFCKARCEGKPVTEAQFSRAFCQAASGK